MDHAVDQMANGSICTTFRQQYPTFSMFPLPPAVWQSDAYAEYTDHLHTCPACAEWYMMQEVGRRGFDPVTFPCVHIGYYSTLYCQQHTDPFDCPDVLVLYNPTDKRAALPIRDGGSSRVSISYCPWCGVELNT